MGTSVSCSGDRLPAAETGDKANQRRASENIHHKRLTVPEKPLTQSYSSDSLRAKRAKQGFGFSPVSTHAKPREPDPTPMELGEPAARPKPMQVTSERAHELLEQVAAQQRGRGDQEEESEADIVRSTSTLSVGASKEAARRKLKRLFDKFDADGSGFIERKELWEVIRKAYKPTREDVDFIMEQFDRDRDGTLDFDEFLSFARHLKDPASGLPVFELNDDTVKKLAKRFLEIDGNGNGRIEVKIGGDERARGEIKRLLRDMMPVNERLVQNAMRFFDKDQDGRINFEEFEEGIIAFSGQLSSIWRPGELNRVVIKTN